MKKVRFNPKILKKFFTYKTREMCKSCKRYGKKATCPPYIDSVDYYKKTLPSYNKGILLIEKFDIDDKKNWKKLGKKSSLSIHNKLIAIRSEYLKKGIFTIIFGAGSCKLCPNCQIPCKFPAKSIIPIEGTGLNVIKMVYSITKIKIKFPVEKQNFFYRVGVMLYD